jgi:deoxycytidylate deaminase
MSLPTISYPYLPKGKEILYVKESNPFMQSAKDLLKKSGCRKHATGAVIVKEGKIIAQGKNAGINVSICPRVYRKSKTGTDYHFCKDYCGQTGHAEENAVKDAISKNIDINNADLYLYGHWWCCKPCWGYMINAGINNVYLLKNAHDYFQTSEKFDSSEVKLSAYISGALSSLKDNSIKDFYVELGDLCELVGINAYVPHLHSDPEKFAHMPASEVYKIDAEQVQKADLMIVYGGELSFGVGQEIEIANQAKTLVILLKPKEKKISRMLLGSPNILDVLEYENLSHAKELLSKTLNNVIETSLQKNISQF